MCWYVSARKNACLSPIASQNSAHVASHLLTYDLLQQKRLNEDGEEIDSDAEDQEPTAAVPDKKKNSRLCSECCSRVAIRACNECGDKFCTKCYKFLHSTGTMFSCVLPYVRIFPVVTCGGLDPAHEIVCFSPAFLPW
jgi:hypothetical protein